MKEKYLKTEAHGSILQQALNEKTGKPCPSLTSSPSEGL